jgi:ABC-2 type transport system permease protein
MTSVEIVKQLRRPRPWVVLGMMAAISVLLTIVIGLTRPRLAERVGDFASVTTNTSGFTLPLIAISAFVLFLLPLGVAVFAGEAVAGEASWGSLRYVLARPVSRAKVLAVKAGVAGSLSLAAVLVVPAVSLLAGALVFGWQPLTVLDLQHTTPFHVAAATFSPSSALAALALASGLVACALASTFAFGILLSTITSRPFSAMAGAVGLGLASRALDNIPGLHALGPWLPLTDGSTTLWTGLFFRHVDASAVGHLLLVQGLYAVAFLTAAWYRFTQADVLS